ncbi:reverse transcriptase family protein [Rhizophagus clarus]|uniref:Reverse transcriptase family protein n=1 Tax=Rhizophagus clarus TaxID=94130 RepID=A0A8H3R681_9GLOM|nr:reverse transcriptase family protein [Rhizophagus clarus]
MLLPIQGSRKGDVPCRRSKRCTMTNVPEIHVWEPDNFGRTSVIKHSIDTGNAVPVKQRFYQTSYKNQLFIKEEIQRLLKAGLIVPSRSQWTSPIDNMLETLLGFQWFSSLDLVSGFWQVELDQKDQEKSTFITRFGTYEFTVMPFGLCNAPATFQCLMDTVLRDILWQFVVVYIDDINVESKMFEKYLLHLKLLKKNTPFVWENDQVDSFKYLKTCLMTPPILSYPNFEKPFILYTDASTFALGAILSQKNEDKKERVIAYASRTLGKHERNYGITQLECLAVVWAVKHFHHYLHGQKFTVITDHAALRYLLNLSNLTGRLGRWLMFLNSYNLEIINRPGK